MLLRIGACVLCQKYRGLMVYMFLGFFKTLLCYDSLKVHITMLYLI